MILDLSVFNSKQDMKLTSDLSACSDFYMRQALTDACYTDQMLTTALQYMPKFRYEMEENFGELVSPAVDFMKDLWALTQFSNQRCIHYLTAALTANKAGLRRKVLNKFTVHPKTRQMLTYSAFTSESVFGHLPAQFLTVLRAPQQAHMMAKDKPLPNAGRGRGRGQKRTSVVNFPGAKKSKLGENYVYPNSSVFYGPASNPKGGGAGRGRGKSGGRGRAKN